MMQGISGAPTNPCQGDGNEKSYWYKFLGIYIVLLVIGLIWPIYAYYLHSHCDSKLVYRWILNELTFSLVHPFVFSVAGAALGLLAWDNRFVIRQAGILWGIILVFLLVMTAYAMWTQEPAMVRKTAIAQVPLELSDKPGTCIKCAALIKSDELQARYLDVKDFMHQNELNEEQQAGVKAYKNVRDEYLRIVSIAEQNSVMLNYLATVGRGTNVFFSILPVTYFWVFLLLLLTPDHRGNSGATNLKRIPSILQLLFILGLITLWVPCRVYADNYELSYFDINPKHEQAVVAFILIVVVFLTLLSYSFNILLRERQFVEAGVALFGVFIALMGLLNANVMRFVSDGLRDIQPRNFALIASCLTGILLLLCRVVIIPHRPKESPIDSSTCTDEAVSRPGQQTERTGSENDSATSQESNDH